MPAKSKDKHYTISRAKLRFTDWKHTQKKQKKSLTFEILNICSVEIIKSKGNKTKEHVLNSNSPDRYQSGRVQDNGFNSPRNKT